LVQSVGDLQFSSRNTETAAVGRGPQLHEIIWFEIEKAAVSEIIRVSCYPPMLETPAYALQDVSKIIHEESSNA
jgi:hypothetical protein